MPVYILLLVLVQQYFGSELLITAANLNLSARQGIGVYMYPHEPPRHLPWERHSDPDCHASRRDTGLLADLPASNLNQHFVRPPGTHHGYFILATTHS